MIVFIDGQRVEVKNDIRVVYDVLLDDEKEGSLTIVANAEGVVADLFDETGENCIGTGCVTAQEKADELQNSG